MLFDDNKQWHYEILSQKLNKCSIHLFKLCCFCEVGIGHCNLLVLSKMFFVDNKQWHYEMQISVMRFLHHNFFITCFIAAIMLVFIRSLSLRNCSKICYASHLGLFSYFSLLMMCLYKAVINITLKASHFP